MKYIIVQNQHQEIPYIFPNFIQHIDFSINIIEKHKLNGVIVGAGFVIFKNKHFECYGKSISLGIKSRWNDHLIINNTFNEEHFLKLSKTKKEDEVFDFY